MKTIEERLADLEAVQAIRMLKHRYMQECDHGYPPATLGPMFAEDAVWENAQTFGRHEGRAAIEAFFGGVSSEIVFAAHLALNDIIEVDGKRATGKWRILMPCTMMEGGKKVSRWMLGDYDETYVLTEQGWKFQSIDFFINFNTPEHESWAGTEGVRTR